jgi:hypothetical protein
MKKPKPGHSVTQNTLASASTAAEAQSAGIVGPRQSAPESHARFLAGFTPKPVAMPEPDPSERHDTPVNDDSVSLAQQATATSSYTAPSQSAESALHATSEDLPAPGAIGGRTPEFASVSTTPEGPRQSAGSSAEEFLKGFKPKPPPAIDSSGGADIDELTRRPSWLNLALQLTCATVLITILVVVAQMAFFYNQISMLPAWLRPVAYTLLVLASLAVCLVCGRLGWLYIRLGVSPRLQIDCWDELKGLERARQEVRAREWADARTTLTGFLERFTLGEKDRLTLRKVGVNTKLFLRLEQSRGVLLPHTKGRSVQAGSALNDAEWLQAFETDFLGALDAAAHRHTLALMKSVFKFTAMSPKGALHTLAMIVASYKLVSDLCILYRMKAGPWETSMILFRILVNLAASTQVDDLADTVHASLADMWRHTGEAITAMMADVFGKVLSKAAEGGTNAMLLWRLSLRTQEFLRPVQKQQANRLA